MVRIHAAALLWAWAQISSGGNCGASAGSDTRALLTLLCTHEHDASRTSLAHLLMPLFTGVRGIGILGSWLTSCPSAHTFPSRRNKLQPLRATWTWRVRGRDRYLPPLLDPGQLPYQLPAALGRNASLVLRRGGKEF